MKENASEIGHILFHFWENCTTSTCSLGGKGWTWAVWSRQGLCQLLPLIWWALGIRSLSAATHWDSCDVCHRYLLPHTWTPVMFATVSAATHWDSCDVCQISAATHWDSCDVCQISAATHWDSCDIYHSYHLLPYTGTPVIFTTVICCQTVGLLWYLPQLSSAARQWDFCDIYHSYHLLPDSGTPVIFTTVIICCQTVGLLWYLPQLSAARQWDSCDIYHSYHLLPDSGTPLIFVIIKCWKNWDLLHVGTKRINLHISASSQ